MVLAPFIGVCFVGIKYMNSKWIGVPIPKEVDRGKFLALCLWNTSGFLF